MICGLDEAGRGPLIGPLVVAAVAVDDPRRLPRGLKDSKLLAPAKREALSEKIVALPHAIRVVEPAEIDAWVFQNRLNWLEAKHMASLIRELAPQRAIVDCPSRNVEAFAAHLRQQCPGCEIQAEFKADANHRVVAAASILAKVTRDRLIAEIREECGVDFGSGYLTDPKTQAFLASFDAGFPHFRRSWRPYQERLSALQQRTLL